MAKPSIGIPQGTRDFGPGVVRKRNYILNTIRGVFELYGFQPLETPAMENVETLMGKYGDEGDKLIFKILNNGLDNAAKAEQTRSGFENILTGKTDKAITERALKYDLTIPFARYVAMHYQQLVFPFKRYQIQPVWRADRPQKGRYREFYQCDADIVGSNALINETELALLYNEVINRLKLTGSKIKINHRKILAALAEQCGGSEKLTDITVAIDKLDKIGIDNVKEELLSKQITSEQLSFIEKYLGLSGSAKDVIEGLSALVGNTETGRKGIEDISTLVTKLNNQNVDVVIDPTLARGLNYYTGIIFEVAAPSEVKIGSIGGGGRYDDLTGLFGVPNIPGVGISFGVDRIYDVMEELNLFPDQLDVSTKVLFFNLGEKESEKAFELMQELRTNNISCELYHERVKLDKQFKYAEKKKIPFVIIIGENELKDNTCTIKNLQIGKQDTISTSELVKYKFLL